MSQEQRQKARVARTEAERTKPRDWGVYVRSGKVMWLVDMTPVLQQLEVTLIDHWRGEGVNSGQTEVTQLLTDCCESNTPTL